MSSKQKKKTNSTKPKRSSKKRTKSTNVKSRSRKAPTKVQNNKKGTGIKAGGELGINMGGRTLGKLEAGGEVGVKENKKGSGKVAADVNLGLESEALDELKEGGDLAFDKIKAGMKSVKKKISKAIVE